MCPYCHSTMRQVKNGRNRGGTQRYLCHTCGISYTPFLDYTDSPAKPVVVRQPCPYCHNTTRQSKHGARRYKCKACGGTYAPRKRSVGISWDSHAGRWRVMRRGKTIGRYKTIQEAEEHLK